MSYNIGVIAEGFRDIDVIEEVLSLYISQDFRCLPLQPDEINNKANGNGWEGVWKWCLHYGQNYKEYLKVQSPRLDALVIQLDGDTTREKKMFCNAPNECGKNKVTSAVFCTVAKDECEICISDDFINCGINSKYDFLHSKISSWISSIGDGIPQIICLPFDSTESWIIAAFDGNTFDLPIEHIEKPGDMIIAKKAYYYEHRVPRKGQYKLTKNEMFYKTFLIPKLISQWSTVIELCSTAGKFENEIRNVFK